MPVKEIGEREKINVMIEATPTDQKNSKDSDGFAGLRLKNVS